MNQKRERQKGVKKIKRKVNQKRRRILMLAFLIKMDLNKIKMQQLMQMMIKMKMIRMTTKMMIQMMGEILNRNNQKIVAQQSQRVKRMAKE